MQSTRSITINGSKLFHQGFRKAIVKPNLMHSPGEEWSEKPIAVMKHTHYLSRWYYDGYQAFDTQEEAEAFAQTWVGEQ